jgi:hypothetical protein
MKDEALKLALEALDIVKIHFTQNRHVNEAITAIKQALAAPVQEPDLIARLKSPEHHYEFTDQKKANAVLMSLCQEAADALAAPVQEPVAGQPLPCPFCGHIGLDFSDGETYRWGVASCGGCGASCGEVRREYPDKSEWHTEAIAEWNRRPPAAQRQWVGLTDEEIDHTEWIPKRGSQITYDMGWLDNMKIFARAIEAKLKEKNT